MERAHEGIRAEEWPLVTGGLEWWRFEPGWNLEAESGGA